MPGFRSRGRIRTSVEWTKTTSPATRRPGIVFAHNSTGKPACMRQHEAREGPSEAGRPGYGQSQADAIRGHEAATSG